MSGWLCWFLPCRWQHVATVTHQREINPPSSAFVGVPFGLYQCRRCKTLSVGAPRPQTANREMKAD